MIEDELIARIAELYYIHDLDQVEIAKKFNFSIAKVSRIVHQAKTKGIIQFKVNYLNKEKSNLEQSLEEKFSLKEAIIKYSIMDDNYDESIIFKELSLIGSDYFKRILKDNLNIGLTWGKTIFYFIKGIEVNKKYSVNVFSTLGGVSLTKTEYQNNNLAQMLCGKIGGNCYPIYLPLILDKKEYKEIFIENINIKKIIGDTSKIDYYFAGLGSINEKSRLFTLGGFDNLFYNELKNKKICGEIGLNFFDSNGNFIETSINNRTIQLDINDIRKTKNKVIVAFGKSKLKALKGFLKTKLTDVLITDSFTAKELLKY